MNSTKFNLSIVTMFMCSATVLLWIMPVASSYSVTEAARKDTLKLVQVIFRHGARSPTNTYPKDPYNVDLAARWPDGVNGQLTSLGKMEHYELGQFLRHRYDGFLGEKYSPKELYTLCSDMDRTIMSLESNLAGLFPPVNFWNPKIDWQPIPLRTVPWKEDRFLHNNVRCPRYYELRSEFISTSAVVRKMNEENEEFIRYCVQHSGLKAETVRQLYPLLDVLYSEAAHNFTLPEWVLKGNVLPKLIKLNGFVNTWPTYTDEMKKLWGGPFLNLLIKNMRAIAGHLGSNSNPEDTHSVSHGVNRKMIIYSAHDSTLSRIMNTLGIFDPHCPPFAAAIIIELHQNPQTQEYFVEYHYRNDTTRAPYLLTHEKCGYPCKFRNLIEIYRPLIPTDWEKECRMDSTKPTGFYVLKMNEHDDHFYEEDEEEHTGYGEENVKGDDDTDFDWTRQGCYLTAWQLALMGIGLFASSALMALIIVKVLQQRNPGLFHNNIDGNGRPLFARIHQQHKPFFYTGAGFYERL